MKRSFSPATLMVSLALAAPLILAPIGRADDKPALSLAEVLARYRQAVAPAAGHAAVKTQRTTGTTEYGGLHGTFTTIDQFPSKHWEEDKLGISDDTSGTDGKTSWQRDTNGNVRLQSEQEQKNGRTDTALSSDKFAQATGFDGKVSLRPKTDRKTGAYVLDVAPEGGKATTLYLDPQTWQIIKEERQQDSVTTTTVYSDFKMLGGHRQPAVATISNGDHKSDTVITTTAVEDNVDAPDTLFALPVTTSNFQWVKPGATSATIPFDYSDKSVALYCALNGRPAFLELDSGASGVAISKYTAETLNLPHTGSFQAQGYGGKADTYPVKLDTFEVVDGVVFPSFTATSLPLFRDAAIFQALPIVGLIGYDLLSRFVVRIDYANQELTLIDPATWKPTAADGVPLLLDLDNNVPSVLASFDGLPPARFLVDTGDSVSAVRLYGPYVAANQLYKKYRTGLDIETQGVGGISKQRRVRGQSLVIGGLSLANVPTDLSSDSKGAGASRDLAGALGTEFLSHFTVTFDYPHSRLFFGASDDTKKPFDTHTFGVRVGRQNNAFDKHKTEMCIFVDQFSPAADDNLRSGSVLLKIDGQDVQGMDIGEVNRMLSLESGKTSHQLDYIGPGGFHDHIKVDLYDPLPPKTFK